MIFLRLLHNSLSNLDARFNKALIDNCRNDITKYCSKVFTDKTDDNDESNDEDENNGKSDVLPVRQYLHRIFSM